MSSEFLDNLLKGSVSRRAFLEKMSSVGAGLPLIASPLAGALTQQGDAKKKDQLPDIDQIPDDKPTYSPANIGGGRVQRDFYRRWLKISKVPSVEGYSIVDGAEAGSVSLAGDRRARRVSEFFRQRTHGRRDL
jgi:hypothetical protein